MGNLILSSLRAKQISSKGTPRSKSSSTTTTVAARYKLRKNANNTNNACKCRNVFHFDAKSQQRWQS